MTGEATLPLLLPASSVSGSSSARIASWIGAGGAVPPPLPRTTPETLGSLSETGAMLLKKKRKKKSPFPSKKNEISDNDLTDVARATLILPLFLSSSPLLSSPRLSFPLAVLFVKAKPAASSFGRDNNDAVVGSWC